MKYKIIINVIHIIQVIILNLTYYSLYLFKPFIVRNYDWVVGVVETAGLVQYISKSLGNSLSVNVSYNIFYKYKYDFCVAARFKNKLVNYFFRIFYLPTILGYLAHKTKGIIYIGGSGFLIHEANGRAYEFIFLKSKAIKIVCYFCGSEIRSIQLMDEFSKKISRDVITTYFRYSAPQIDLKYREIVTFKLAKSADKYADYIFNAPIDQLSYIDRPVHPFIYFYPVDKIIINNDKFKNIKRIKIVHAPSSPIIKGTPLVRAAIKKLEYEGYIFEYKELINTSNEMVLEELHDTHIVLNQFYGFMPGLFGIEGMASKCAVLMSADERIETSLPENSNLAWFVTEYWNIYKNLKILLDDTDKIESIANAGYNWALENCSTSVSVEKFRKFTKS